MPVSYLSIIVPLLLIAVPLLFRVFAGKRAGRIAACVSVLFVVVFLLSIYVPGWVLMASANRGDPNAQYKLAKWHESHCEKVQALLLWRCSPDVLAGYAWLEKAAEQDYPPALYAVGVRLKYGDFVPRPKNWTGPGGNVFPQPARGQPYIDKALALGYQPIVQEEYFYWQVYRGTQLDDPYD